MLANRCQIQRWASFTHLLLVSVGLIPGKHPAVIIQHRSKTFHECCFVEAVTLT